MPQRSAWEWCCPRREGGRSIGYCTSAVRFCQGRLGRLWLRRNALRLNWQCLCYYFLGWPFILVTDHTALKWLNTMKDTNARVKRWYIPLQPFKLNISQVSNMQIQFIFKRRREAGRWLWLHSVLSRHPDKGSFTVAPGFTSSRTTTFIKGALWPRSVIVTGGQHCRRQLFPLLARDPYLMLLNIQKCFHYWICIKT